MKNTAQEGARGRAGRDSPPPHRGGCGRHEPPQKVTAPRAFGNGGKRANYGLLHHRETACSHERYSKRKPKNKVSTALPSEARATQGACVMARPRDGRRSPKRATRSKNANSTDDQKATISVRTILHGSTQGPSVFIRLHQKAMLDARGSARHDPPERSESPGARDGAKGEGGDVVRKPIKNVEAADRRPNTY